VTVHDRQPSLQVGALQARLMARFTPPLRPEQVERALADAVAALQDAPVRMYLPVLIERAATRRLERELDALHRRTEPKQIPQPRRT
jgi:hypothetical protein